MGRTPNSWTRLLALVLTAAWSAPAAVRAQLPSARQIESRVHAYMQAAVQNDQFSGTILVARGGVPIVQRGYGMANYELNVADSTRSVYLIASLTKQFTAMAIMQLRDRGRLALTDPICNYLDDCPTAWQPITIRQLLTHTSGIVNFSSLPEWDDSLSMRRFDRQDFVGLFRNQPLLFVPSEDFKYSNSGYYLLALIIECASGEAYSEFLRHNIFAPLRMVSTRVEDTRSLVSNRATGYYRAGAAFVHALHQNGLLSLGSGGMLSTVGDLLRWDAALYTDTLLKRSSRDEMFTPVRNNYGYGWEIRRVLDRPSTTHSGSEFGYSTYIMRLPAERVTVIVLSNSDRTSATGVSNALAAITFGAPYKTPEPQLFDILGTTIEQKGVEAGVAQYRELKRTLPNQYDFGEEMLNELGYDLLGVGKVSDAVGVFTLAVEMFPTSSNLYDSLGEANMLRGEDALAIRNYEHSLELDAANVNAVGRLAKLRARTAKPRGAKAP